MITRKVTGDQALAYGALAAGVRMVTSYPGSPGSGAAQAILDISAAPDLYFEWSVNERVALELGIGASLAGRRALVCVKSVGMNTMLDTLMVLNLTGTHGGLVILLGDDPGAYGSQNDQDTRPLATMIELPMLEPARVEQGYSLIQKAFDLSEEKKTVVILRITRSFSQAVSEILIQKQKIAAGDLGPTEKDPRFFPYPANAIDLHADLHAKLEEIEGWLSRNGESRLHGAGPIGVLTAGFVTQKLFDLVGDTPGFKWLELTSPFPPPRLLFREFLGGCSTVLVLEENEPYVENLLKTHVQENRQEVNILGKASGHIPRVGELFRWQIQEALVQIFPDYTPRESISRERMAAEKPGRISYCEPALYEDLYALIDTETHRLGRKKFLIVDPGCQVSLIGKADAKFAMGSAIGVADGIRKSGRPEICVAMFGDSAFFHSGIPALCNAGVSGADLIVIVVNNHGARTTGSQPSPNTGWNARGQDRTALDISNIAAACGVEVIEHVRDCRDSESIRLPLRRCMESGKLALLEIQTPLPAGF